MLRFCMKDYKIHGVTEIDHGSYSVKGTTCIEAKINCVVSRVNLVAMDYDELLATKTQHNFKRRGRKRKADVEASKAVTPPRKDKYPGLNKRHFNGESVSGKRQRKPNSKFSDYVIPSNYSIGDDADTDDQPLGTDANFSSQPHSKIIKLYTGIKKSSDGRPKLLKTRVKERILSTTDDEQKSDISVNVDPLDLHRTEDVVHSFLPMLEPSEVAEDDDSEPKVQDDVENTAVVLKEDATKPLILNENNNSSQPPISDTENALLDVSSDKKQTEQQPVRKKRNIKSTKTPTTRKKSKLTNSTPSKLELKAAKMLTASRYILVDGDMKYKPPKVSDIDFNKLVRSLKSVKLPAKNWKIRIIVSPQETITEVIFTNKEEVERCVKFSRTTMLGYKITFGKAEVKLLGAPTLQTFDDIAVLLEIIHSIAADSQVLEYC